MKSTVFWDITPYSLLKVNLRFGGTYRIHLQGRINRPRYQHESRWQAKSGWSQYVPPKRRLTFNGLHGFIFQKMVDFRFKLSQFDCLFGPCNAYRLRAGRLRDRVSIPGSGNISISSLQRSDLWNPPSFLYNVFSGVKWPGMELITHLYLGQRLRMYGAIPPLPHTSWWCSGAHRPPVQWVRGYSPEVSSRCVNLTPSIPPYLFMAWRLISYAQWYF
jgi:hypothetical protein